MLDRMKAEHRDVGMGTGSDVVSPRSTHRMPAARDTHLDYASFCSLVTFAARHIVCPATDGNCSHSGDRRAGISAEEVSRRHIPVVESTSAKLLTHHTCAQHVAVAKM